MGWIPTSEPLDAWQSGLGQEARDQVLTGGKKAGKWLKESCLLTGGNSTVRLFSLSVQERTTPPQGPALSTPSSGLEREKPRRSERHRNRKREREMMGEGELTKRRKLNKLGNGGITDDL